LSCSLKGGFLKQTPVNLIQWPLWHLNIFICFEKMRQPKKPGVGRKRGRMALLSIQNVLFINTEFFFCGKNLPIIKNHYVFFVSGNPF